MNEDIQILVNLQIMIFNKAQMKKVNCSIHQKEQIELLMLNKNHQLEKHKSLILYQILPDNQQILHLLQGSPKFNQILFIKAWIMDKGFKGDQV